MGVLPWGAYPGNTLQDIQSGMGMVHNTLLLDGVQKSVLRAPFRIWPKPLWFADHRRSRQAAMRLTELEYRPSLFKVSQVAWEAMRG